MLSINSKNLHKMANEIDKISKNSLKNVVLLTVSDTAGLASGKGKSRVVGKKEYMIKEQEKAFKHNRTNSSFYRAFTQDERAKPNKNINKIVAKAGIVERNSKGINSTAKAMQAQEEGGSYDLGIFSPLDKARVSKDKNRRISKVMRNVEGHTTAELESKGKVVVPRLKKGRSRKATTVAGAIVAKKKKKFLMIGEWLYKVKSVHLRKKREGRLFTAEAIFKKQQTKSKRVKGKWFLKKGAIKASERAEELFNKHAEKKIRNKTFK